MAQVIKTSNSILFPGISFLLALLCQAILLFGLARWFAEPTNQLPKKIIIRLLKPIASTPPTRTEIIAEPENTESEPTVVQESPALPLPAEKVSVVEKPPVIEKTPASEKVPAVKPEPVRQKPVRPVLKAVPLPKQPPKTIKATPEKIKILTPLPQNSAIPANKTIPDSSPRQHILPVDTTSSGKEKTAQTAAKPAPQGNPVAVSPYLNIIRQILQKNLRYPSAARRRNVSGIILVSFQIRSDGSIFNPIVKTGSDRLLRKAALDLVEKIRLPIPPIGWQKAFVIEIPLKYSLK